jgi:hypothetical protein
MDAVLSDRTTFALPPPSSVGDDPSLGVTTFLRRWEMNGFLFLVLIENLRPTTEVRQGRRAWFSIVPESARRVVIGKTQALFNVNPRESPFLTARILTATVFLLIAISLALRAFRAADAAYLNEAGFLTLAWFWLLCPTQNPWYWTWAMPLLPFARGRAWIVVSGLALLYYLRFWFDYHWADTLVWGSPYTGVTFFDFVVTWLEFGPWFVCLALGYVLRKRNRKA